jgi:phosphatidylserine/phosphatidylglycerophosphate/cardiolipin synthase-like enzyme
MADDLALDVTFRGRLLSGKSLYEEVLHDRVLKAKRSVWIATANVKELLVPNRHGKYVSIVAELGELIRSGVQVRLLHAELPSKRFRAAFDRLAKKKNTLRRFQMKQCPRVHFKFIVVDGEWVYLGSANFTGAGLGCKGDNKRNFELGLVTEDFELLDRLQSQFQSLWSGEPCRACALRESCPDPGGYGAETPAVDPGDVRWTTLFDTKPLTRSSAARKKLSA